MLLIVPKQSILEDFSILEEWSQVNFHVNNDKSLFKFQNHFILNMMNHEMVDIMAVLKCAIIDNRN